MFQTVMGWLAVSFHISGYSYQSSKIFRHKKTSSLSVVAFTMNFVGSTLWLLNGIFLRKIQPTITNLVVLTSVAVILFYIVKHNFGWSHLKAMALLIFLLLLTWGLFIMHMCDMYVHHFLDPAIKATWLPSTIAIVSAILTSTTFAPQLWKMFKTKDTEHVSHVLVACYGISNVLWLIYYATMFNEKPLLVVVPILIAASISAITQASIFTFKFINERKSPIA